MRAFTLLGLVLFALSSRCFQTEQEPNNSWPYANVTGTIPAESPQTVCGTIVGADEDWWKIALDYHVVGLVEGDARLKLHAKGAAAFLRLRLYEKAFGGGFHYLGSWTTVNGALDTGPLGLTYYKSGGFNVLYAAVSGGPGTTDYYLSFW